MRQHFLGALHSKAREEMSRRCSRHFLEYSDEPEFLDLRDVGQLNEVHRLAQLMLQVPNSTLNARSALFARQWGVIQQALGSEQRRLIARDDAVPSSVLKMTCHGQFQNSNKPPDTSRRLLMVELRKWDDVI
jgi:hypothetical protein